jgi:hypothetical protein
MAIVAVCSPGQENFPYTAPQPESSSSAHERRLPPAGILSEPEVNQVVTAASQVQRHGLRDATLIPIAYRHAYTELAPHRFKDFWQD